MQRRMPTFPVRFLRTEPTKDNPEGGMKMYYADEYAALLKSQQSAEHAEEANNHLEPAPGHANIAAATPSESSISSTSFTSFAPSRSPAPPDFSRHSRRCSVCSHPDRDAIEGDFIRWRSPGRIANDYKIPDRSSIYRHAHSTGLFAWRKEELGRVLESILESCEDIPLESADVLIRAARIYSHLDEHGYWFEPPRTNYLFTGPAPDIAPFESILPTNSGRTGSPGTEEPPSGEEKANRNIAQFKNPDNSLNPEEKANS